MIYEIKKAFEALMHPGINTSLYKMAKNALPYYLSPEKNVPPPLTIYWSINSICNMKCKMCDIGQENVNGTYYKNLGVDKKAHEISLKTYQSVIDEVHKYKPHIAIVATEPLLYKDLPQLIKYTRERNVSISVTTAGYLLEQKAEALIDAGLNDLAISIDGPSSTHNYIRGRDDAFEKAIAGIKKVHEYSNQCGKKCKITISCVINNLNYNKLAELASLCQNLPIDLINFVNLWFITKETSIEHNQLYGDIYPVSESCIGEFIDPSKIDVDILRNELDLIRKMKRTCILGDHSRQGLETYYHNPEAFLRANSACMAAWMFIQVLADGRVIPFTRCHNEPIGNLNENSLLEIWNSEKMKKWRIFIKDKKRLPVCKRCDLIN